MKTKSIKALTLNKKAISNINFQYVKGGLPVKPNSPLPDPKTVSPKLCYLQDNSALHCGSN